MVRHTFAICKITNPQVARQIFKEVLRLELSYFDFESIGQLSLKIYGQLYPRYVKNLSQNINMCQLLHEDIYMVYIYSKY